MNENIDDNIKNNNNNPLYFKNKISNNAIVTVICFKLYFCFEF